MSSEKIKRDRLVRLGDLGGAVKGGYIRALDDVVIQVTQAYCPNGHNLVNADKGTFEGAPGIWLKVSAGGKTGEVVLSPYHGDHRRLGFTDFEDGTRVEIACPVCGVPLPRLIPCSCGSGDMVALYLTPDLDEGHVVALCDVWGCHRSKVFDQAQLLSAYLEEGEEADDVLAFEPWSNMLDN